MRQGCVSNTVHAWDYLVDPVIFRFKFFLSVTVILLVWCYMCVFDLLAFAQLYSIKELIGDTEVEKNRLYFCNTHYSFPHWPPSYILI